MHALVKFLIGIFGIVAVFFALIFVLNSADVVASEGSKAFAQSVRPTPGLVLSSFPAPVSNIHEIPNSPKFSDYLKAKSAMDALLTAEAEVVDRIVKAYKERDVEIVTKYEVPVKVSSRFSVAHKLFLMHVSQLFAEGKTQQALDHLIDSNLLLRNLIETPQLYLPKLIALSLFQTNALFVQDLQHSKKMNSVSAALKVSLRIGTSTQQIIETSMMAEFMAAKAYVEHSKLENGSMMGLVQFLLRPQETVNWLAQIYSDLADPKCNLSDLSECSETYKTEIVSPNVVQILTNPTGRRLIRVLMPNSFAARSKLQENVDAINGIAATL